ncbi:MAG TPA: VWA domain-containing protein [Patescibacteria group bacterium]|jgi:Ca-activated chloride channel family protein|nr:VWA domain-containing protein [Patescibacteria group bacterium]
MIFKDFFIQFAYPQAWQLLLPATLVAAYIRWAWYRPVTYKYSLGDLFHARASVARPLPLFIFDTLRLMILCMLALLIFEPRIVDKRSQLPLNGIDIMLVLDVSGSMQFMDYDDQKKSRIDVAKQEAVRFISARNNDAIGLVIFGNDAVSRCPITVDKRMLKKMIDDLYIGIVDPEGTVLSRAIITAANRLKQAVSVNKVMIVLTDGEPSAQDLDMSIAIKVARDVGIKVYTVGIGSESEEFFMHPFYGVVQKPKVNAQLLAHIANQTGGQFFMARNASDMRKVYQTIDQLEKTVHQAPIFGKYYDLLIPLGLTAFCMMGLYSVLSTFVWFVL